MNIETVLRMVKELKPYESIELDTELIKSKILDSMGIFNLVSMLEEEFDIIIDENEMSVQNFSTVNKISLLLNTLNAKCDQVNGD